MQACRRLAGQTRRVDTKAFSKQASLDQRLAADAILLKGLQFFGYHGVLKEEQVLGQKFCVDARLTCCLKKAGRTDDVQDTVSYADVFSDIQQVLEGPPHELLESVAHTISLKLLDKYPKIQSVELRLTKPHVAVMGNFESLGIETVRTRPERDSSDPQKIK